MLARAILSLVLPFALSSCGFVAPEIKEAWDGPEGTMQIEYEIKKRVYCDLRDAVQIANLENQFYIEDKATGKKRKEQFIPDDWGTQISLSLQVDESSALNPGLVVTKLRPNDITHFSDGSTISTGQSFSLGAGGSFSATATRIDKFDIFYTIGHLMKPGTKDSPCLPENDPFTMNRERPAKSSPLIVSDLGIKRWLTGAMFANSLLPSENPSASPGRTPDTVTLEVKFVIVTSGNLTPTWRLMPVSVNTTSNFFSTGRIRTHDLIITIGPQKGETSQTHFASQIGQAVSAANFSALRAP